MTPQRTILHRLGQPFVFSSPLPLWRRYDLLLVLRRFGVAACSRPMVWYIYRPHWNFSSSHAPATISARQGTYLKRSTVLSWELGDADRRFVASGASLRASRVGEVSDPVERRRHDGSADRRWSSPHEVHKIWSAEMRSG